MPVTRKQFKAAIETGIQGAEKHGGLGVTFTKRLRTLGDTATEVGVSFKSCPLSIIGAYDNRDGFQCDDFAGWDFVTGYDRQISAALGGMWPQSHKVQIVDTRLGRLKRRFGL